MYGRPGDIVSQMRANATFTALYVNTTATLPPPVTDTDRHLAVAIIVMIVLGGIVFYVGAPVAVCKLFKGHDDRKVVSSLQVQMMDFGTDEEASAPAKVFEGQGRLSRTHTERVCCRYRRSLKK